MKRLTIYLRVISCLFYLSLTSCNLPIGAVPPTAMPELDAFEPPITSPSEPVGLESFSEYFIEEFDVGIPPTWQVDPIWVVNNSILSAKSENAVLAIPGNWQEMTLIVKFRLAKAGKLGMNLLVAPHGAYHVEISENELSVIWLPEGDAVQLIATGDVQLTPDWHLLVVRIRHGTMKAFVDDRGVIPLFYATESGGGSLSLINLNPGSVEIDYLVVGPP